MKSDIIVQGWPFLYGRGREIGAQVVVAPRSFSQMEILPAIVSAINPSIVSGDPNKSYMLEYFSNESSGSILEFVMLFRVIEATSALIGEQPSRTLLDTFGRPFPVVEGIVFRSGEDALPSPMSDAIWNAFEVNISPIYSQCWHAEKAMAVVFLDDPITLYVHETVGTFEREIVSLEPQFIQEHLDWTSLS